MVQTEEQDKTAPFSFRFFSKLISHAPHPVLYCASRVGGFLYFLISSNKRKSYLGNITGSMRGGVSFKPWSAFQNHTLNVLELLKAPSESPDDILKRVIIRGREHLDEVLERKKGLIIVTIHSGNWELSGIALALHGYPITTIAGEQLRDGWSEKVKDWKRKHGIKLLYPGCSMRHLYRDLDNGRFIVLHMDGNLFSGGIAIDFLGKQTRLPRGPAHLSRMTGTPVFLAVCRRRNRNHLEILIKEVGSPPKTEEAEMEITRQLAAEIEDCILAEPSQWCIFRKLHND